VHELSLCKAISGIVERHADGRRVSTVHLDVGALRQVVPDSLVFCWGLANAGTPWETSELDVRLVPARLTCLDCGASTELTEPFLVCGTCESRAVTIASGDELLVTSIDLVDA
jgi:hydrogenase nickel incorporation protein HypA/HybF